MHDIVLIWIEVQFIEMRIGSDLPDPKPTRPVSGRFRLRPKKYGSVSVMWSVSVGWIGISISKFVAGNPVEKGDVVANQLLHRVLLPIKMKLVKSKLRHLLGLADKRATTQAKQGKCLDLCE